MPSAVPQAEVPALFTVNVPLAYLALPAKPVEPISRSDQPGGKFGESLTVSAIVAEWVKLPDFPVIVTVAVPVVAVLLAVSVSVLVVAVAGLGLKDAMTPLGRPEAEKVTLLLKPFCGVTVIVLVPLAPCAMLRLVGDAEIPKFGTAAAVTMRLIVAVFVKLPEVPVMVTETVPVVAVPLADSVSVLVVAVAGLGLEDAMTPLGRAEADRLALLLKPVS